MASYLNTLSAEQRAYNKLPASEQAKVTNPAIVQANKTIGTGNLVQTTKTPIIGKFNSSNMMLPTYMLEVTPQKISGLSTISIGPVLAP